MFTRTFTALFAALVAGTAAKETRLGRQFLPADISGEYSLFVKQGSCSKTVSFTNVEPLAPGAYSVAHSDIKEDGAACTSAGSFRVITKEAIVKSGNEFVFQTPPLLDVVNALDEQSATFMIGFEREPRVCGAGGSSTNTIAVFVEEKRKIQIPGLINLFPGAKYMIVYEPTSPTPCTYYSQGDGRIIGLPATPEVEEKDGVEPRSTTEELEEDGAEELEEEGAEELEEDREPAASAQEDVYDDEAFAVEKSGAVTVEEDEDESLESTGEPSASPEEEGPSCFPADATVELDNGITKRMEDVTIGDMLRTGESEFSPVFMFTHKLPDVKHSFLKISTASGHTLSLTSGHFLYANGMYTEAKNVQPADVLSHASGDAHVTEVSTVKSQGLYNPQTMNGEIMVNGFRASTYTSAVESIAAHSLLLPFRAMFQCTGYAFAALEKGAGKLWTGL